MTLDAIRARRHSLALTRIADERVRRGRVRSSTPRAPSSTSLVIRENDDDASGSPATIVRLSCFIRQDNYYDVDAQRRVGTFIEKIVHKSGPVLVQPAFGPDDVGRDGHIVIKTLGDRDAPPDPESPEEPETPSTGGTTA